MPPPGTAEPGPALTRRRFCVAALQLTAIGTTAACTGGSPQPDPATPTAPDPARALLADNEQLIAVYDATIARHPSLAARLRPLRAEQARHGTALRTMLGVRSPSPAGSVDGRSPSEPASPTTSTPSTAAPGVPSTTTAALAALRSREKTCRDRLGTAAVAAPAPRAATLASMAASDATHLLVLR